MLWDTWDRTQESVHAVTTPDYSDSCCFLRNHDLEMQQGRKQSQKIQAMHKPQVEIFVNEKFLSFSIILVK